MSFAEQLAARAAAKKNRSTAGTPGSPPQARDAAAAGGREKRPTTTAPAVRRSGGQPVSERTSFGTAIRARQQQQQQRTSSSEATGPAAGGSRSDDPNASSKAMAGPVTEPMTERDSFGARINNSSSQLRGERRGVVDDQGKGRNNNSNADISNRTAKASNGSWPARSGDLGGKQGGVADDVPAAAAADQFPPASPPKGKSEEKPAVPSRKNPMHNTASDVDRSRSAAGGEGSRSWSTVADRANSEATDVASRQLRERNEQLMSETERMHGRMRELEIKLREKDKVSLTFGLGVSSTVLVSSRLSLSGLEFISLTSIFHVTSLLDKRSRPRTRGCAAGWAS